MSDSVTVRPALESDEDLLIGWLLQPGVLQWFPLDNQREIQDAAKLWMSYSQLGAALIIEEQGVPCGTSVLYIQSFEKLAHQCLFAIIIDENYRGKGLGRRLLEETISLAKERFHIELLHLEVYDGNPAIHLYERLGFIQYGYQRRFIKESKGYLGKVMMQRRL